MKIAQFYNFTDKKFTGYWNGKPHDFAPQQKKFLPAYLAEHFAKHLANSVLMDMDKKDGVSANYTSPKRPADVPQFKTLFDKACLVQDGDQDDYEIPDETETHIALANSGMKTVVDNKPPQIITPADANDDDEEFDKPTE